MIRRFDLENFKSFRSAQLPLAPLTLLIGPNASGKSNAIEGLQLLSWMASGQRLGDFQHSVREEEVSVRGTLTNLCWDPQEPIRLGAVIDGGPLGRLELSLGLAVSDRGLRIVEERLEAPGLRTKFPLYEIQEPAEAYGNEVQVAFNNFARGKNPRIKAVDQQPVFTQFTTPSRFTTKDSQDLIPKGCEAIRQALEAVVFLDPSPRRMRDYSFPTEQTLQGDGSNLSAVLWNLVRSQEAEAILSFVRSLPEQDIESLEFLEGPRGEVMVQLQESFGHRRQLREAAILSDGTLRILSVAAAVLSVPKGSLVIIEEIDNGVHPSRADLLLTNLQRVAEARQLSILLTTHNPALQDALPVRAIPAVVAAYRDPETGESHLRQLEDMERYPELVAQGTLGDLNTRGILEAFLKDPTTPDERRARARSWLESLRTGAGG